MVDHCPCCRREIYSSIALKLCRDCVAMPSSSCHYYVPINVRCSTEAILSCVARHSLAEGAIKMGTILSRGFPLALEISELRILLH